MDKIEGIELENGSVVKFPRVDHEMSTRGKGFSDYMNSIAEDNMIGVLSMEYEVFYKVEQKGSFIVKGETREEIHEKTEAELEKRNGIYQYSIWLNE